MSTFNGLCVFVNVRDCLLIQKLLSPKEFVNLKVQVWDHDKILKDDLVETFFSSNKPWLPNHGHQKKTIRHKSRVVQLTLDLEVYCNKNYYGPHCTKQCVPGKTYTCGLLGEKVCRANWYGKSCTVECIPRDDWRGHYTWGKRSVDQVIMERAALDGVPLEMTREMDISTVIGRETKSVFLVGKGHPVNDA